MTVKLLSKNKQRPLANTLLVSPMKGGLKNDKAPLDMMHVFALSSEVVKNPDQVYPEKVAGVLADAGHADVAAIDADEDHVHKFLIARKDAESDILIKCLTATMRTGRVTHSLRL